MLPPSVFGLSSIRIISSRSPVAPTISSPTLAYLNSTATTSFIDAPIGLPPENSECSLLGPFAIFVQGLLGLLALTALVFKRRRERPQRPIKIWFFDVSKQVVGSLLVHMANLAMSMLSSGQLMIRLDPAAVSVSVKRQFDTEDDYIPNPCSFYLLNLAIDVCLFLQSSTYHSWSMFLTWCFRPQSVFPFLFSYSVSLHYFSYGLSLVIHLNLSSPVIMGCRHLLTDGSNNVLFTSLDFSGWKSVSCSYFLCFHG